MGIVATIICLWCGHGPVYTEFSYVHNGDADGLKVVRRCRRCDRVLHSTVRYDRPSAAVLGVALVGLLAGLPGGCCVTTPHYKVSFAYTETKTIGAHGELAESAGPDPNAIAVAGAIGLRSPLGLLAGATSQAVRSGADILRGPTTALENLTTTTRKE